MQSLRKEQKYKDITSDNILNLHSFKETEKFSKMVRMRTICKNICSEIIQNNSTVELATEV